MQEFIVVLLNSTHQLLILLRITHKLIVWLRSPNLPKLIVLLTSANWLLMYYSQPQLLLNFTYLHERSSLFFNCQAHWFIIIQVMVSTTISVWLCILDWSVRHSLFYDRHPIYFHWIFGTFSLYNQSQYNYTYLGFQLLWNGSETAVVFHVFHH